MPCLGYKSGQPVKFQVLKFYSRYKNSNDAEIKTKDKKKLLSVRSGGRRKVAFCLASHTEPDRK
jgi:hypothetical protein